MAVNLGDGRTGPLAMPSVDGSLHKVDDNMD